MIVKCNCKHEGQDKLYGEGMRVYNKCRSKATGKWTAARCTICLKEKEVGEVRNE